MILKTDHYKILKRYKNGLLLKNTPLQNQSLEWTNNYSTSITGLKSSFVATKSSELRQRWIIYIWDKWSVLQVIAGDDSDSL